MCISISIGKWGGIYWYRGFGWRLCMGWIAITYFPFDGDELVKLASSWCEILSQGGGTHESVSSDKRAT